MTQKQIVNVNIQPDTKSKRRKRHKKGKKVSTRTEPQLPPNNHTNPTQNSAFTFAGSPNRPYVPFTSYISSPFNNGIVPDQVDARSSQIKFNFETRKTLEAIEKSQKDMLTWYPELTKTLLKQELRTLTNAQALNTLPIQTLPNTNLSTNTSGLSSSEQHSSPKSSSYEPTGQHIEIGLEDAIANLQLGD
jgi:hypothetical protein